MILTLLTVFSYLDRQVLALLVPDLRRELGISDVQIGLLIGPAFVVTYCLSLLVAGFVVDRCNKIYLIVGGVLFWSVMTFAAGFATSFGELIVLRAGLAVGEALLGPAAAALIGDLFESRQRSRPTALFTTGAAVGASGSAAFSAAAIQIISGMQIVLPRVGAAADWRMTLIAVSLPSFMLGIGLLAYARLVGVSGRAAAEIRTVDQPGVSMRSHLKTHGRSYSLIFLAGSLLMMTQIGVFIWTPSYLMRAFYIAQTDTGYAFGSVALACGVTGTLTSAFCVRAWAASGNPKDFARIALVLAPIGVAGLIIGGTAQSVAGCLASFAVALFALGILSALPMQFLQLTAPAHLRGRIAVGFYFLLYLLGSGAGPLLPPTIGKMLFAGPNQLGLAIATIAIGAGVVSITLLALVKSPDRAAYE